MENNIKHFVAEKWADNPIQMKSQHNVGGFWAELWVNLRKKPTFYFSVALLLFVFLIVVFPGLFSKINPQTYQCDIANASASPNSQHIFGFDIQGCDVFSQVIYGARPSVAVGVFTTILVVLSGGVLGAIAGYYGGILDSIISRVSDIFFSIPLLLAAIVILQSSSQSIWNVIIVLALFGWPQIARITRGAVIEIKNKEYVSAAKSLGVGKFSRLFKHVIPNAISPVIVAATMSLGSFIVAEATLSFLGVGLPVSLKSWGYQIDTAQNTIRTSPSNLFWPSLFLLITVLGFILLGDALRDALNPKDEGGNS
jgi:oligopeptide transport system permease protein